MTAGDGPGRLLVVATPLGNLSDLTARAAGALRGAALVACEDTRRTRGLLAHLGAAAPTLSVHRFNESAREEAILDALRAGGDVALVTDAGTPGVSDPGARIVAAARAAGFRVEAIPGPSAPAAAMSASGFEAAGYVFAGYAPPKAGARRRFLESLRAAETARATADPSAAPWPIILFEAPHRIIASLEDLAAILGARRAVVFREMTKLHEETISGTLVELRAALEDREPRGEYTLVIEGRAGAESARAAGPVDARAAYRELVEAGVDRKEALRRIARATGRSRRDIYREIAAEPGGEPPSGGGDGGD